jgi:hypothetical protein
MGTTGRIRELLTRFEAISLEEVQKASLMSRKDSKYVFGYHQVPDLLEEVTGDYRVLEVEGRRAHSYQTLYYDTPTMEMYRMHHSGRVNRHKIRFRNYGSSDDFFLEVKKKDARGVTIKNRIQTSSNEAIVLSLEEEFLSAYSPYLNSTMIPVLENSFNRITLVNPEQTERITLDYHLWFSSRISDQSLEIPGVSIAEIKFENHLSGSPFHAALRRQKVRPTRFSKYCTGMAVLNPDLKQNLFKENVRLVKKINKQSLQIIKY